MAAPKKPQDRKPKAADVEAEDCFTFTHAGVDHTLKPTLEHLTPGFMRANRQREDLDAFFTILEELADDEQLAIVDGMSHKDFGELAKAFYKHLGATQGELTAS